MRRTVEFAASLCGTLTACFALAIGNAAVAAEPTAQGSDNAEPFYLHCGERVLFLGDSNTMNGGYIHYLDAFLYTRFPDKRFELINLGLASETASGLSEPDHPFPRPDVLDRLDRRWPRFIPTWSWPAMASTTASTIPFRRSGLRSTRPGCGS